jgi:hypothetical protein
VGWNACQFITRLAAFRVLLRPNVERIVG